MSILVGAENRIIVQGITGRQGLFHTRRMLNYKTRIVAGVTPGKGGLWVEDRIPVFDTVATAVEATGADTSVIFVPASLAKDALLEAADAGIRLVVCITENIPVTDMLMVAEYYARKDARLVGPNCPGILSPGICSVGIIPTDLATPGTVGVVARSGTLTYEVMLALSSAGIGQSTCVGVGGDAVKGMGFVDVLTLFEADVQTERVVLIGEIGGNDEELAAAYIADKMTKPVVAYIAGHSAPLGRRMGHAGAIFEGSTGTAAEKVAALMAVNVRVARYPDEIPNLLN